MSKIILSSYVMRMREAYVRAMSKTNVCDSRWQGDELTDMVWQQVVG